MMNMGHFMMPKIRKCSKPDGSFSKSQLEIISNDTSEAIGVIKKDNDGNGLKCIE